MDSIMFSQVFFCDLLILMETFEDGPLGNLDWIFVVKEYSLTMLKHHLRSDEVIPCWADVAVTRNSEPRPKVQPHMDCRQHYAYSEPNY